MLEYLLHSIVRGSGGVVKLSIVPLNASSVEVDSNIVDLKIAINGGGNVS